MSTATTKSAPNCRASCTGRLSTIPPSTSGRPSHSTGGKARGIDMLALTAQGRLPRVSTSLSPLSRAVATARKGRGSFEKSPSNP